MLKQQDFYKTNDKFKLTVLLVVYNMQEFLKESLDSIIMQKVNFPYQLLIADDHSTDGSFEIIQEYAKKYPFIKVQRPNKNLGIDENGTVINYDIALKNIDTQYIALLEGDDYWVDENKLQEQYDFLEKNQDCIAVYDSHYWHTKDKVRQHENIITDNSHWSQTGSTLYRNVINFDQYPVFLRDDGGIYFIFLVYGKVGYRDKITHFYREHATGAWSSLSKEQQALLNADGATLAFGFCLAHNINPKFLDGRKEKIIRDMKKPDRIQRLTKDKDNIPYINIVKEYIAKLDK